MHITLHHHDDLAELDRRVRVARQAIQRDRLRAVRLALDGLEEPVIRAMLGRSRDFVQKWAYAYRDGGLDAVAATPRKNRPTKLPRDQEDAFRQHSLCERPLRFVSQAVGHDTHVSSSSTRPAGTSPKTSTSRPTSPCFTSRRTHPSSTASNASGLTRRATTSATASSSTTTTSSTPSSKVGTNCPPNASHPSPPPHGSRRRFDHDAYKNASAAYDPHPPPPKHPPPTRSAIPQPSPPSSATSPASASHPRSTATSTVAPPSSVTTTPGCPAPPGSTVVTRPKPAGLGTQPNT